MFAARHFSVISKVLAARMRKLITARARKSKRTARMLTNARKEDSIPLILLGSFDNMKNPRIAGFFALPPFLIYFCN